MAKYKKNPKLNVVFMPGLGRLRDATILEGDKYEKFTTDAFGCMLVPYTGDQAASGAPPAVTPAPVSSTPAPSEKDTKRPSVRKATLEGIMADYSIPEDQEDALIAKSAELGDGNAALKKSELVAGAEALGFSLPGSEKTEPEGKTDDDNKSEGESGGEAEDENNSEGKTDDEGGDADGEGKTDEGDESKGNLTEEELASMSIPKMRDLAALNNVEIPAEAKKKEEIHNFLHTAFFGE